MVFYYIYKALAHPEHDGYVEPVTLAERLIHVKEAERRLGSRIPWLCDTMDNTVQAAFGTLSNVELVVDAEARVVRRRMWSDPQALRKDLEELVGPVANPTRVEDLDLQQLPPPPTVAKGIVPRVELPGRMWPLEIEPALERNAVPFFVKLRADGDPDLITTGRGTLYVGFHLDPIHRVHWNNEAPPVKFEIQAPPGVTVTPASGTGPKVEEPADADPREFLIDVAAERIGEPLDLSVKYYACDDELTFCIPVKQRYRIRLERDISHGWAFRTADAGTRSADAGTPDIDSTSGASGGPIARFDKDGDGTISRDEAPPPMRQRFKRIDTNRDGKLDRDELRAFAEKRRARGPD